MFMNKGIFYAAAAYGIWGFFPILFKAVHGVPALQITAHRIVWCFLFLILIIAIRRDFPGFKSVFKPRILLVYLAAAILLAVNWLTFVWAVNAGFVIESSLGYFINPLVSVLLGVIFLGEKLRPMQWVPVGLAAAGVAYLTFSYGSLPWISLMLAFSFGLYGLVKKVAPLGSLQGLTLETGTIFLPALAYLLFEEINGAGSFGHAGSSLTLFLIIGGLVTAVPLLLFATSMRTVPLSIIGFIQYITPTIQFLIGVFLYAEPFTPSHLVGFSLIWLALLVFSVESFYVRGRIAANPV
jgi:chloramphenicol-sensitive protein RarD